MTDPCVNSTISHLLAPFFFWKRLFSPGFAWSTYFLCQGGSLCRSSGSRVQEFWSPDCSSETGSVLIWQLGLFASVSPLGIGIMSALQSRCKVKLIFAQWCLGDTKHQIFPGYTSKSIVSTQGTKAGTDASIMLCILVQSEIKILPSVPRFLVILPLLHMLKQLVIQAYFYPTLFYTKGWRTMIESSYKKRA